ncbi:PD-(D/E)XK nuclease family protein [Deinococcus soli (ex Cha et al. 2016)]|uniref:PD-(D/E)XK nuclease family protein n=1 Tax=Deinococcus soli (ex Cha et al. 2016) TaxID=1309411 RepID=UPI00227ABF9A|nr:PD-(D/E)XK nuclease family protein [Deinococcus soli (ex Cha et al. 2016)]
MVCGARADLIVTLGLNEGIWPAPPRFHSHLDAHARAALHRSGLDLPTVQTHVHHERDLYWWTQHAASYCISLYPQVVNGSPRVVSDLLVDAAIRPASPIEAPTPDPTTSAPSPSEFGESPFDLLDLQLSPTQMTRFGQCSFRWFAQYGLNLKDLEEPSSTLAPHVRGRLYHHTLDFVAKGLKDHPEASLDSLLTEGFAAAETHENLMRLPNWIWQRAEHLQHLLDLVQAPEFLPEGHVVHVSEQDFTVDWFGLTVKGTLDRLDQTADGFVVTDYKTGSDKPKGACGSDGQLSLDVQLPIYLSAASHLTTTQVTRGRYLSMTKRERRTLADANPDLAGLEALAASFVRSIETGHFPVAPDERQEACQYCSYGPLCRYSFDGGEEHDE